METYYFRGDLDVVLSKTEPPIGNGTVHPPYSSTYIRWTSTIHIAEHFNITFTCFETHIRCRWVLRTRCLKWHQDFESAWSMGQTPSCAQGAMTWAPVPLALKRRTLAWRSSSCRDISSASGLSLDCSVSAPGLSAAASSALVWLTAVRAFASCKRSRECHQWFCMSW